MNKKQVGAWVLFDFANSVYPAVITTTVRKALTLLFSFVFFPKPFVFGHFVGISLFIMGVVMKSTAKPPPRAHVSPVVSLAEIGNGSPSKGFL